MPARWLRIQLAVTLALTALSLAGQASKHLLGHDVVFGFVRAFDVDLESNVPAWWQTVTLAIAAGLAGVLCATTRAERAGERGAWWWIAVGLSMLSLDEALSLHNRLTLPTSWIVARPDLHDFTWLAAGAAVAALAALGLRGLLRSVGGETSRRLLLSLAVYAAGALGGEALSAAWAWVFHARGFSYVVVVHLEELLEMTGVALVTWTLATHLRERIATWRPGGAGTT